MNVALFKRLNVKKWKCSISFDYPATETGKWNRAVLKWLNIH